MVTAPARADYAGEVQGGGASVAISIHGGQAIAYVCNGSVIEAWYKGTAVGGVLIMTGKNHAHLSAIYDFKKATGDILAHGTDYRFSVAEVHKPSGLYQAIAVVRGATIKAGWIVLPDGTQVGSLEPDADAAAAVGDPGAGARRGGGYRPGRQYRPVTPPRSAVSPAADSDQR